MDKTASRKTCFFPPPPSLEKRKFRSQHLLAVAILYFTMVVIRIRRTGANVIKKICRNYGNFAVIMAKLLRQKFCRDDFAIGRIRP